MLRFLLSLITSAVSATRKMSTAVMVDAIIYSFMYLSLLKQTGKLYDAGIYGTHHLLMENVVYVECPLGRD